MSATLRVDKITKKFGSLLAVDEVSFSAQQGEVVGFLGPNGAGKSTTMKMITGFLASNSGTAYICGYDINEDPIAAKQQLGYLPEGAPAYPEMTVRQFLSFIAQIRGISKHNLGSALDNVVHKVNLGTVLDQKIDTLSKGFKRRVGLAQALIHDPKVLILDEPTDGLDPNQKFEVRKLIKEMSRDKVIILSTHILEEVEAVCDRVVVVAAGKVITDSTPAELLQQSPLNNTLCLAIKNAPRNVIADVLSQLHYIENLEFSDHAEPDTIQVYVQTTAGKNVLDAILNIVCRESWKLMEFKTLHGQLDEVFRNITQKYQKVS